MPSFYFNRIFTTTLQFGMAYTIISPSEYARLIAVSDNC